MTPKMNCYYWSLARLIGSGGRGDAPQNGHQKIGSIVTNVDCQMLLISIFTDPKRPHAENTYES